MYQKLFILAALLTLAACAAPSGSTATGDAAESPPYEMMKDPVLKAKVDRYMKASMNGCLTLPEAQSITCIRNRLIEAWPQGKLAGSHCASRSDPYEDLNCLTMTTLAIDLIERAGDGDPSAFVTSLGADDGAATGEAAIRFAKAVWKLCPDGANARQCRVASTLQKLNLTPADATRCAPLADDRKTVSCLILSRFRNEIDAATDKLGATGS
jgi:hypothetical protein